MNRAEHYAAGFSESCRWAEQDIRDDLRLDPENLAEYTDKSRAWCLGTRRGYRDTWNRFEAGTLTFEMFESAPL